MGGEVARSRELCEAAESSCETRVDASEVAGLRQGTAISIHTVLESLKQSPSYANAKAVSRTRMEEILQRVHRDGRISKRQIGDMYYVDDQAAGKLLRALVEGGFLRVIGKQDKTPVYALAMGQQEAPAQVKIDSPKQVRAREMIMRQLQSGPMVAARLCTVVASLYSKSRVLGIIDLLCKEGYVEKTGRWTQAKLVTKTDKPFPFTPRT